MVIIRSSARLRPPASYHNFLCLRMPLAIGCSLRRTRPGPAAARERSQRRAKQCVAPLMDGGPAPAGPRPYRGTRRGNRRIQHYYRQQDLASAAIQRLVRTQCGVNNFVLPRIVCDQTNPYTALIVNADWFLVQALIEPEVTRLAPYVPSQS